MAIDDKLELVNFPIEKGRCKVIQIEVNGKPVVVFGPQNALHRDILERYLTEQKVAITRIPVPNVPTLTMPALEGPEYRVVGMGESEVNPRVRFLQLPYGESYGYKIGIDKGYNQRLKTQLPGWNF